jgi:UDPglucose 6-dehydrogenase
MRIAVLGAGYVGLVTAASLAELGHDVCCIDTDRSRIGALSQGLIPFFEPGLTELVTDGVAAGKLSFTDDIALAVRNADVAYIAVGTPPRVRDGDADLRYVLGAASDIVQNATGPIVIVTKSTVPVGTGDIIEKRALQIRPSAVVHVVSNPEFLREGSAVRDVRTPDRIVVGANSAEALQAMRNVYAAQIKANIPFLEPDRRTSELIKYAANAFLATKIAFVNEVADLCEEIGSNIAIVASGMGLDRRIGSDFLQAGPGYGGSCFPKDTMALLRTAQDHGVGLRIVQETLAANDARKRRLGRRVSEALGGDVQGRTIAVLGLSFKANTDDVRESPAIPLIESLQKAGALVRAYDPEAMANAAALVDGVEFADDAMSCLAGADVAVIVTDWDEFRRLRLSDAARVMRERVVVDFRNVIDPGDAERNGFACHQIGRAAPRHGSMVTAGSPFAAAITPDASSVVRQ